MKRIERMKENTRELSLLVVEDNKVFQAFYEKLLSSYFKGFYKASDGREGLNMYLENPYKYDIIIVDHLMPKMNGLDMIMEMKKINPEAHVIFITGSNEISVLTEVAFLSIDAVLTKPVNKIQLLTKIEEVATKIVEKRHMHLYIEQLEQMNQAIWHFKDVMRKKIQLLEYIPQAKSIHFEMEQLLNRPISLMGVDSYEDTTSSIEASDPLLYSENDEDFDVEKAMREYSEEEAKVAMPTDADQASVKVSLEEMEYAPEHDGRFKDIRYSVVHKVSAEEFVSEVDEGTFSELDDFKEGLDNFNLLLNDMSICEASHFYGYIDQVVEFYERLHKTIRNFVVFSAIENTFEEFAKFLENISLEQLEDDDRRNILVDALFALNDDLSKWINIVFYEKNTDNIHYFDASFANTCLEIESMFHEEEAEAVEADEDLLEFF